MGVHVNNKKEFVLNLARSVAPLITHASSAVRARAIQFVSSVSHVLSPADTFARLLPMMKGTLPQGQAFKLSVHSEVCSVPDPYILDSEEIVADALHANTAAAVQNPLESNRITINPNSSNPQSEDLLNPKPTVYSTRVSPRMVQCGLTRHKASLEVVSKSDAYMKWFASHRKRSISTPEPILMLLSLRDTRSQSALMTYELSRASVKLGSLNGMASASSGGNGMHSQVRNAMSDALNTGISSRSVSQSVDAWKPEGVLLAHYVEHRRRINQIAVSKDASNPFFVTGSNDGTVKVWDLKQNNDDLSFRSCATYAAQKGEILSVTPCEDNRSIASASRQGTIHVWRVNYAPHPSNEAMADQFTGISCLQEIAPEEGAVLHVQQWDALLLYTSQRGIVHAWDIRMKNDAWKIRVDPKEGLIRRIAADPLNGGTWIVTGSSQGVLDLWDVRFQVKVAQWIHPSRNAIVDVAPTRASLDQMRAMGIKSQGPFVYVAAGGNEVGLWDIQEQACKQVQFNSPYLHNPSFRSFVQFPARRQR